MQTDEELLEENGWIIECQSPFEIRDKDGSFASGTAAYIVLDSFRQQDDNKLTKWFISYASCISSIEQPIYEYCVIEDERHPVVILAEWNLRRTDVRYSLLNFKRVPKSTPVG